MLPTGAAVPFAPIDGVAKVDALLADLQRETPAGGLLPPVFAPQIDNQLIQVRLGIASSLFAALRCRYPAAASHSLRVALGCSAWALKKNLGARDRDAMEVAALLHDIGYVGIPDQVLLKPGVLDADETRIVEQSRRHVCRDPPQRVRRAGQFWRSSRTRGPGSTAPRAASASPGSRFPWARECSAWSRPWTP